MRTVSKKAYRLDESDLPARELKPLGAYEATEERIAFEMFLLEQAGFNPSADEKGFAGFCSAPQADRVFKENNYEKDFRWQKKQKLSG